MRISKQLRAVSILVFTVMFLSCFQELTVIAAEEIQQQQLYEEKVTDLSSLSDFLKGMIDTTEIAGVIEEPVMIVEEEVPVQEAAGRKAAGASLTLDGMPEPETEPQTQALKIEPEPNELYLRMEDGTTNYYAFSEDIKYEDENGEIHYKETTIMEQQDQTLLEQGYGFSNGTNDYRINFSSNPSQGVYVKDGTQEFSLRPAVPDPSPAMGEDDDPEPGEQSEENETTHAEVVGKAASIDRDGEVAEVFEYRGIFGEQTTLRFLPQLNAVKTEIILDEYTGQNEFSFLLDTHGKKAVLSEDSRYIDIVDPEDEEHILTQFLAPFAYDAEGGEWMDEVHYTDDVHYELEEVEASVYRLTYVVPESFLTSEGTVYPVTIDPVTGNVFNSVDVPIYSASNWKGKKMGNEQANCFGKTSQYGNGRVLVKFNIPSAIKEGAAINSAEYFFRELTGRTTNTYVRPYIVTKAWDNNTTWDSRPSYDTGSGMTRKNIKGSSDDLPGNKHWYKFELKNAVQKWVKGTANHGVIFVSEEEGKSTNNWRSFASKETTTSNWRPYVVINYTNDTAAPTITDVTGNPTAWTKNDVKLTATGAKDAGAGLHATPYSFSTVKDTYKWQASATSPAFNKNQTVYVYLRDKLGNIALRKTVTINRIDKDAPTITDAKPGTPVNGKVKISVTGAKDAGAGLHSTPYSFSTVKDSYSWQASATSAEFDYTKTVYVYVRDTLGNTALRKTINIKDHDKTAPTISKVDVDHDNLTVTVTASDAGSGIGGYSFDGGATWQAGNKKTFPVPEFGVQVKVKDKLGNTATYGTKYNVGETRADALPYIYEENGIYKIYHANGKAVLQYKVGNGAWATYKDEIPVPPHEDVNIQARVNGVSHFTEYSAKAKVGVYATDAVDLSYEDPAGTIEFARYYDTERNRWGFTFDVQLTDVKRTGSAGAEQISPDMKELIYPDGSIIPFVKQKDGSYQSTISNETIIASGTNFELRSGYSKTLFDSDGRIVRMKDENGNEITYSWTLSSNTPTKLVITDSVKRTYTVTFSDGKPVSIAAPGDKTVRYTWNGNQLTSYTNAANVKTNYSYSGSRMSDNGTQALSYDENGRISRITQRNNSAETYTYDDAQKKVTISNTAEQTSHYIYDDHGWTLSETDYEGKTIEQSYYRNGLLQSKKEDGKTLHYGYDNKRNLTAVTNADQTIESYKYDANDNITQQKDEEGVWTSYQYDSKGNVTKEVVWKEEIGSESNADDVSSIQEYTYYANGLVRSALLKERRESGSGDAVSVSLEQIKLEEHSYDPYGYQSGKDETDYTGDGSPVKRTHVYTYDITGNLKKEVDGDNIVNEYTYDILGQKTAETLNGKTTTYVYDQKERMVSKKEADADYAHRWEYDAVDNLVKVIDKNNNDILYTYDNVGNLSKQQFFGYTFDYNVYGSILNAKVGGQDLVTNVYSNDAKKLLDRSTYANGQSVSFTYQKDDKVSSVSFSGERDPRFAYTYSEEEDGEITTIQDSCTGNILDISEEKTVLKDKNGTLLYSYETKSDDDFSGTIEKVGGKEYKVIRTDDSEEFVCAGNQNLIRTYQKNADDKLMSESTKAAGASKNAIESTYTYKTKDLLSGITHKLGNDTVTYSYTYDDNNQLTAVSDGTHTTSYVYDKNKQLIRVNDQKANRTTVVDYDRRGNITSKADYAYTTGNPGSAQGTVSYEYGDSNWKDKLTRFDGKAVTYDAMGNPLSYDGWSYEWEGGRQLKSMQKGSMAIQYSYDANGIRTSKKVGSVTTTYHTVGGRITYQSDGTNTLYFRYNADESLYGLNHNGTEYLYVLNLQGDVVALTDTSGAVVVSYTYDAWGNVTGTSGRLAGTLGSLNPMRYRSYYFDSETGYYYLQSRYYDAGWGRFINADEPELLPTIQVIDSSMNLFVYCNNAPTLFSDYTGMIAVPMALKIGFAGKFGIGLAGKALLVKMTAFLAAAFPYLLIFVAAVVAAFIVYKGILWAKQRKIPGKLKNGNKVKTPSSHSSEFTKKKGGAYTHKKTGWNFKKSKDGHYNGSEHWHASPKNAKTGNYYNVTPNGNIL